MPRNRSTAMAACPREAVACAGVAGLAGVLGLIAGGGSQEQQKYGEQHFTNYHC